MAGCMTESSRKQKRLMAVMVEETMLDARDGSWVNK